ncbi:hypothetical protein V493_00428 [Pseudogymnoascus sp. VKM F-4281 (FW-2241)]|nr:hypothetical protein V493_00428 [Pseudogymnoascus sp. VKM F-4281 (FW-2241)]
MANSPSAECMSTCSSLGQRALSGALELDMFLADRADDGGATELEHLRSLATKLHQLSKGAEELPAALQAASVTLAELHIALAAQLSESEATAALVVKQIMRLGKQTPSKAIDVATVLHNSIQDQQVRLGVPDAKYLLAGVSSACRDAARSAGILLDTDTIGHDYASKKGVPDTDLPDTDNPPEYLAYSAQPPPPFEKQADDAIPASTKSEADWPCGSNNDYGSKPSREPSTGFRSSLAGTFKAATAMLRTKPEPLVAALCQAAMIGNVAQIESLLAQGANVNGRNEHGQTSLICASIGGHSAAIEVLLSAGADHRACDEGRKGKPPLFHVVDSGSRAAVEMLLKHRADANQSDQFGLTYFTALVVGDTSPKWLSLLLSNGADACAKDLTGRPLVILALDKRKKVEDVEEVVRVLLHHGARRDSRDADGTALLYLCGRQHRAALVNELLDLGADPNAKDVSGISLLATAVKHNDRQVAKALLKHRADANAPDIYGSSLIVNVLRDDKSNPADRDALAEMLLEHGARGDKKDMYGVTALELSLMPIIQGISGATKLRIPELLLQQGADPSQQLTKVSGGNKPTLLSFAIERELWDLAALALKHGANANQADKKGRTPLLQAVQKGSVEAVTLLLQHGAGVNQPLHAMPLDLAMALGNAEII